MNVKPHNGNHKDNKQDTHHESHQNAILENHSKHKAAPHEREANNNE